MNTQEHQGKPEQREGMSGRVVEIEWDRIIDKERQRAGTRTEYGGPGSGGPGPVGCDTHPHPPIADAPGTFVKR